MAYMVSIGSTFHGLGDFFNRFLSAQGKGKQLRNSNFILGACNIIGYTGLVYILGVRGATITKLIAGIVYLGLMIFLYRRYLKNIKVTRGKTTNR
jgi:Na+-driven multidrug efflux pump